MSKAELELFSQSIRSPATRKNYEIGLEQFKDFSKIKDLLKADPKSIENDLINYVIHLKKQGASYSKQNITISAVQKFCEVYDILVNFKKVRKFTSEQITNGDDKPYSMEALRMLLEHANLRTKAIILLMLTAGLRIGAVPILKIRHLEKIKQGVYRVTVYADSKKDRYVTFTTPEATKAIDDYLKSRQIKGEKLKPDSPLFRKEFDVKYANESIEPIYKSGLFKLIQELAVNAGLRRQGHKAKSGYAPRHETPLTHSFRKIANTAFVKAGVKPVVTEMLLGHSIGLQRNYLRLSEEELFSEYAKAIDLLTVSNEKALQKQVEKLQSEAADVDGMKRNYWDLKSQLDEEREERAKLYKLLYAAGVIKKEP